MANRTRWFVTCLIVPSERIPRPAYRIHVINYRDPEVLKHLANWSGSVGCSLQSSRDTGDPRGSSSFYLARSSSGSVSDGSSRPFDGADLAVPLWSFQALCVIILNFVMENL